MRKIESSSRLNKPRSNSKRLGTLLTCPKISNSLIQGEESIIDGLMLLHLTISNHQTIMILTIIKSVEIAAIMMMMGTKDLEPIDIDHAVPVTLEKDSIAVVVMTTDLAEITEMILHPLVINMDNQAEETKITEVIESRDLGLVHLQIETITRIEMKLVAIEEERKRDVAEIAEEGRNARDMRRRRDHHIRQRAHHFLQLRKCQKMLRKISSRNDRS